MSLWKGVTAVDRPTVFRYDFAGHPLRYHFHYPLTRYRFLPLPVAVVGENYDLCVTEELLKLGQKAFSDSTYDDYVEYRCLLELTSRALLRYDRTIFHAVSFIWNGKAFLLTAPSGVGKTTQYMNWQRLFPGEIEMISGDMPVLVGREDGSIEVWPSPWNGKERIRSQRHAQLGGIVLLEQAEVDEIRMLTAQEAVVPLLLQFVASPVTREEILDLTSFLERLIGAAPVWKLRNRGGDVSTALLRLTLEGSLADGGDRTHGTL